MHTISSYPTTPCLSSIGRMLGFASEIRRGLFATIELYKRKGHAHYIKNYLHDFVVAFVAYDVTEKQLRTANVYVISYTELQNRMNALLA